MKKNFNTPEAKLIAMSHIFTEMAVSGGPHPNLEGDAPARGGVPTPAAKPGIVPDHTSN